MSPASLWLWRLQASAILVLARGAALAPRRVRIDGQRFILSATNGTIVLSGPNVVVKGPPYLPAVAGDDVCKDTDAKCAAGGACQRCTTFNQADVENIRARGWNSIRLGVVWAGAQPRDEDALDPDFLQRLHDLLDLTDRNGIHVILDNHGDMVGSAGCGNGVPMWFQKKAAAELIGKPLVTPFPYSYVPSLEVARLNDSCGGNATRWAEFAGDPNYNLLNSCCQAVNGGNPAALGYTSISQKTMDFLITDGNGRRDFVRFWRLMTEAVSRHPSAVAAELMNEPMSIKRKGMFETWKACAEEINSVVPDMSVSVADTGEGLLSAIVAEAARLPDWISKEVARELRDLDVGIVSWIKSSRTVFYSWHWYGAPKSIEDTIKEAQAVGAEWDVPTFATEFMSCDVWRAAEAAQISHSYWHYSDYCNTGPQFGSPRVPEDSFGACILGWGAGSTSRCSSLPPLRVAAEAVVV